MLLTISLFLLLKSLISGASDERTSRAGMNGVSKMRLTSSMQASETHGDSISRQGKDH